MSLNSTPSRNGRALCVPGGNSTAICTSLAVVEQHAAGPESGDVHAALRAVHAVEVQLVEHAAGRRRRAGRRRCPEPELLRLDVHRPGELLRVEVESEDAVEPGRGQVQAPLVDRDLVAVLEVGVAPGADRAEIRRVGEELVARGDVDDVAVEGDAAQARGPSRGPASRCSAVFQSMAWRTSRGSRSIR